MEVFEKVSASIHNHTMERVNKRIHPSAVRDRSRIMDRDLNRYYSMIETIQPFVLSKFTDSQIKALTTTISNQADPVSLRTSSVKTVRFFVLGLVADGFISEDVGGTIEALDDVQFISLIDFIEMNSIKRARRSKAS